MVHTVYIFGLQDPVTTDIKWVAVSANPKKYLRRLLTSDSFQRAELTKWISGLRKSGFSPVIQDIESVPFSPDPNNVHHLLWQDRVKYWKVELKRRGFGVINHRPHARSTALVHWCSEDTVHQGVKHHTEETKQRISETRKKQPYTNSRDAIEWYRKVLAPYMVECRRRKRLGLPPPPKVNRQMTEYKPPPLPPPHLR